MRRSCPSREPAKSFESATTQSPSGRVRHTADTVDTTRSRPAKDGIAEAVCSPGTATRAPVHSPRSSGYVQPAGAAPAKAVAPQRCLAFSKLTLDGAGSALVRLSARFCLRVLADFLLIDCRGDLSDIADPSCGAWLDPVPRSYATRLKTGSGANIERSALWCAETLERNHSSCVGSAWARARRILPIPSAARFRGRSEGRIPRSGFAARKRSVGWQDTTYQPTFAVEVARRPSPRLPEAPWPLV